jgi:hypothetical protein
MRAPHRTLNLTVACFRAANADLWLGRNPMPCTLWASELLEQGSRGGRGRDSVLLNDCVRPFAPRAVARRTGELTGEPLDAIPRLVAQAMRDTRSRRGERNER